MRRGWAGRYAALASTRVRALFGVLLAAVAAVGLTVAVAEERREDSRPPRAAEESPEALPLPAPDAAISRRPARLAAALTTTTRRLRDALGGWDGARDVPRDVTYLALHHQRMLRLMAVRRALGDARTLGVYSHVDVDTRRRAEAAGFDLIVPRSRLAREGPTLISGLAD